MSKNKKALIGLSCFIAFILVVLITCTSRQGAVSIIKKQLVAIKAGNLIKAYAYTSADFRSATSLKDFEDFIDHYPALKTNQSITITNKEIQKTSATINATLYATDQSSVPAEYLLVKEDNEWKILGIQINPLKETANRDAKSIAVTNMYDNQDSRYVMKYPSSWEYEKANDGTVIFSGKPGTSAFFSTVNVQTVLTKKTGGDFANIKEFMSDIKHQAVDQSPGVRFVDSGTVEVVEKSGTKDPGEYMVFTYKYKGKEFKQWQVVVQRNDGQVFYAWAYTSPVQQYTDDLAVARAMLESWVIY